LVIRTESAKKDAVRARSVNTQGWLIHAGVDDKLFEGSVANRENVDERFALIEQYLFPSQRPALAPRRKWSSLFGFL